MPSRNTGPHSKDDFQRLCAELRRGAELDDMVEALRALAGSSLRARDKIRFARHIARTLSESFHAAEVRAVASVSWPSEIAMAIKRYAPTGKVSLGDPSAVREARRPGAGPPTDAPAPPLEPGAATVVLVGDEDEHRPSLTRLRALGIHSRRVGSRPELEDALAREAVAGIVIGASWWRTAQPPGLPPRRRLSQILQLSNISWLKLVRSPAWVDAADELIEIWTRLYGAPPPVTRLSVEDQATITNLELRFLAEAIEDLGYAQRQVDYTFAASVAQDRIIRAVTSRYLRDKYRPIHARAAQIRVRSLANRGEHGLVALVSVEPADVSFVVKVSPPEDARQEARRFRMVAHGTSFEMELHCHASLGALVFAPIETRLGHARSLEDLLEANALRSAAGDPSITPRAAPHGPSIDAAIAALERFSRQVQTDDATTFCSIELPDTRAMIHRCESIVVGGQRIDLWWLFLEGIEIVDRNARGAVVHGDAHPGNILFSRTGAAILIDFECAGLGPPGTDQCTLWIHALASNFVAVGDEPDTVELFRLLLSGTPFEALARSHAELLRFGVNDDVVYLTSRAIESALAITHEYGGTPSDLYGLVTVLLCRELFNPTRQQLVIRCALAATQALLHPTPTPP